MKHRLSRNEIAGQRNETDWDRTDNDDILWWAFRDTLLVEFSGSLWVFTDFKDLVN